MLRPSNNYRKLEKEKEKLILDLRVAQMECNRLRQIIEENASKFSWEEMGERLDKISKFAEEHNVAIITAQQRPTPSELWEPFVPNMQSFDDYWEVCRNGVGICYKVVRDQINYLRAHIKNEQINTMNAIKE